MILIVVAALTCLRRAFSDAADAADGRHRRGGSSLCHVASGGASGRLTAGRMRSCCNAHGRPRHRLPCRSCWPSAFRSGSPFGSSLRSVSPRPARGCWNAHTRPQEGPTRAGAPGSQFDSRRRPRWCHRDVSRSAAAVGARAPDQPESGYQMFTSGLAAYVDDTYPGGLPGYVADDRSRASDVHHLRRPDAVSVAGWTDARTGTTSAPGGRRESSGSCGRTWAERPSVGSGRSPTE